MSVTGHIRQRGFTIVELLIVIVVIAILAAISIVAYNGIQARAKVANVRTDLKSIQKILELYKVDNGSYPYSGSTAWNYQTGAAQNTFVVGVVPTYVSTLPILSGVGNEGYYLYRSTAGGVDYKLIRFKPGGLSDNEWTLVPEDMKDQLASSKDRYGLWSSGGASL